MRTKEEIKEYLNSLPEVKRIHELEGYIDNNKEIKLKLKEMKLIQKKMVNSKEYNQMKQYKNQKLEYEKIKAELLDLPFVEEYLELLDIVDNILLTMTNEIEDKINKKIND